MGYLTRLQRAEAESQEAVKQVLLLMDRVAHLESAMVRLYNQAQQLHDKVYGTVPPPRA